MRELTITTVFLLVPILLVSLTSFRRFRNRLGHPLSAEYKAYICSNDWRQVSNRARQRAGYRCEHRGLFGRCRARSRLQTHHLHYRDFGREWDGISTHGESLRVLCPSHHRLADRRRRRGR